VRQPGPGDRRLRRAAAALVIAGALAGQVTTAGATVSRDGRAPDLATSDPLETILAPAPDLAQRLRAPRTLATLDSARVQLRRELRAAAGADRQARVARRLAAAHRTALGALRPLAATSLNDALSEAAGVYDALARAAVGTSASRFDSARADVDAADARVDAAVSRLAAAAAPAVRRLPVAAPASEGISALTVVLLAAFGLLCSWLLPAGVRLARRGGRAGPEPEHGAPVRRRPIAPPPTFGRWNEAPTISPPAPDSAYQPSGRPSS
jgi:hypothetical protein